MASIRATLTINEQGNGVISSVYTNVSTNNVSWLPKTTNITEWVLNQTSTNKNTQNTRAWGLIGQRRYGLSFYGISDNRGNFIERYNGLMFGTPTSINGENIYNLVISIVGTDIIAFNIWFDEMNNEQYPLEYSVYSSLTGETTTYTNSDRIIRISGLPSGYGTTRITINKWNVANVPVAMTFFENVELNMELNKSWIQEFETQSQSSSDPSKIEYGLLANTGSINLIDHNNELLEKSKLGYLNTNLFTLRLYMNDKLLQEHISSNNPFYSQNQRLKLELTNKIANWNNINIAETTFTTTSLYNLLVIFLNKIKTFTTTEINAMLQKKAVNFDDAEVTIEILLKNFGVGPFTLQSGTVQENINKICQTAELNCLFKDDGNLEFYSARPIKTNDEKIIVIPFDKQFSVLNYSILVDNRYDTVVFDGEDTTPGNNNYVKIQSNEIMNNAYNQTYNEEEQLINIYAKTTITENILSDYQKGIKNAELSIFPSDLYYTDGTKAKTWKNGEIIEINDIIKVEREVKNETTGEIEIQNAIYDSNGLDVYFRVVDRKVVYNGQPLIYLELREIKN